MRTSLATIFSVLLFVPIVPRAYAATSDITSLVFITPERVVNKDALSDSIIVRTENASGEAETVDETNDVSFTSSSPTGQFLNSSGNTVSTTMNKNTSSRTFFYKDSVEGNYTISITVTGRTTGKTFSSSQSITVGSSVSSTASSTSDTVSTATSTSESANTASSGSNNTTSSYTSSHSGSEEISNFVESIKYGIDAGRERIVAINSPIRFVAKVGDFTTGYATVASSWSFGDGTMTTGREVDHVYRFAGEYNVVLNATIGGSHMVDRTRIRVIEPHLSITEVVRGRGGYVAIKNDSMDEVNIQNFKLTSGGENFYFALDTILSPHVETKFPFEFMGNLSNEVLLQYPEGQELAGFKGSNLGNIAADPDYESRHLLAQRRMEESLASAGYGSRGEAPVVEPASPDNTLTLSNAYQTAALLEAFKQSKSGHGVFSTFASFLGRIFNK